METGFLFQSYLSAEKHVSDVQPLSLKERLNGELPGMLLMDFAQFLIGFYLICRLLFKFAGGLGCKQSLGLNLDNLHAARGAVLSDGQGTVLGLRKAEWRCPTPKSLPVTSLLVLNP